MNDWIMLVTALGGIEGIKQLVKWWMSRKTLRGNSRNIWSILN